MLHTMTLRCFSILSSTTTAQQERAPKKPKAKLKQRKTSKGFAAERKKEASWQCVEGCGACCKLDKGPAFATPDEIFQNPSDIQLYKSMTGPDGWCINYEKETRKCSIYPDRPYFCRVEPDVFESLYGINKKKFNREACRLTDRKQCEIRFPSEEDPKLTARIRVRVKISGEVKWWVMHFGTH